MEPQFETKNSRRLRNAESRRKISPGKSLPIGQPVLSEPEIVYIKTEQIVFTYLKTQIHTQM